MYRPNPTAFSRTSKLPEILAGELRDSQFFRPGSRTAPGPGNARLPAGVDLTMHAVFDQSVNHPRVVGVQLGFRGIFHGRYLLWNQGSQPNLPRRDSDSKHHDLLATDAEGLYAAFNTLVCTLLEAGNNGHNRATREPNSSKIRLVLDTTHPHTLKFYQGWLERDGQQQNAGTFREIAQEACHLYICKLNYAHPTLGGKGTSPVSRSEALGQLAQLHRADDSTYVGHMRNSLALFWLTEDNLTSVSYRNSQSSTTHRNRR